MRSAVDDTIEYIDHLAQQLECYDASYLILIVLMKLRVPTNYDGFEYLRVAILLRYENPTRTMANDIYPEIRAMYGKYITNEQIESAMRGAILIAWKRTDIHIWKLFFPTLMSEKAKRPSSSEFVDELARIVELLYRCAGAYARQRSREEAEYGIQ